MIKEDLGFCCFRHMVRFDYLTFEFLGTRLIHGVNLCNQVDKILTFFKVKQGNHSVKFYLSGTAILYASLI